MKYGDQYLKFIRSKPCVLCGQVSEAAHEDGGGMALKASDMTAIPLCKKHHIEGEHKQGFKSFWSKQVHNRNYYQKIMLDLFIDFVVKSWPQAERMKFFIWLLQEQLKSGVLVKY